MTLAAAWRRTEDRKENVPLNVEAGMEARLWAHGPHDRKARFRESQEVQMLGVQGAQSVGENMLRDRKK